MFQRTTAIDKLLAMKARKRIVQGGTYAAKTYGIIALIINTAAAKPNLKITVVAETIPAVKDGPVGIFKSIMQDTNRWFEERWNGNPMQYTFGNGSVVQFKSFDSVGKAKQAGKRDVLFINEANYIPFEIANELIGRSETTWIDYNPNNSFWVHDEIIGGPNTEYLLLKYTDNEACPAYKIEDFTEAKRKATTSSYWANWCRVYIDGEIGNLQGVIFDNWTQVNEMPGKLLGYGIDFGFVHSPTAIVQVNESDGEIYVKEHLYKIKMHNDEIFEYAKNNLDLRAQAIADSADPKTIDYLHKKGWTGLKPAIKGTDSVRAGINLLMGIKINVTRESRNLIDELRKYSWDTDKTGKPLNEPIKAYDHAIDALRYLYSYPKKRTNLISA